ncbi:MAG TPA: hypothetical protein VGN80_18985 [Devosiaceae bacterium]|jgi:hypothetical protein|nr:hypothetical protein [Devosiaceae bacterium]
MSDPALTIRAAVPHLRDPESYVRSVLENLFGWRNIGWEEVRLAVNGDAAAPHYNIEAVMDQETGEGTNFEAYSGKTHKPLSALQRSKVVWSTEATAHREVAELLGELRHYQPKAKPDANRT